MVKNNVIQPSVNMHVIVTPYNNAIIETSSIQDVLITRETDTEIIAQGVPGVRGASAYEIAVENGFSGTEKEWLDSLVGSNGVVGPEGPVGPKGDIGPVGPMGPQGIQGIQGPAGVSGEKGDKGEKGDAGVYVGSSKPTDSSVNVWIDLDGQPDSVTETWVFTLEDGSIIEKQVFVG